MHYTDNLRDILARQKEQTEALARSIQIIEQSDLTYENEKLRAAAAEAVAENERLLAQNHSLKEENKILSEVLNERRIAERLGIVNRSREQLLYYFGRAEDGVTNRLTALEDKYKLLLNDLKAATERDITRAEPAMREKWLEVEAFHKTTLQALRDIAQKRKQALGDAMEAEMSELTREPLLPGTADRLRRLNREMRFGMKVVNILGVLLILLGVVFGLQYTYVNLLQSDALKSAAAYALGLLFLLGGEALRRTWRTARAANPFAIGITAGGLGILFAATAISYFSLSVISAWAAAGICAVVSLLAFFLSVRHNTRTIACMALIGGYLPLTALSNDLTVVYGAFIYFTLLNLLALFLATQKKWTAVNGLTFVSYAIATLYLVFIVSINHGSLLMSTVYLMFHFFLFLAATLLYPATHRTDTDTLTRVDIALLAANTVVNGAYIYLIYNVGLYDGFPYNGLLAVGFCLAYAAAAYAAKRFIPGENRVRILFMITALTFAVLVVPFQFGWDGILIGWLVEGVLLIGYGVLRKDTWFEKAGAGVVLLAAAMFIPWLYGAAGQINLFGLNRLFFINFTAMALGTAVIAAVYRLTFTKRRGLNALMYFFVIFWLAYTLYAASYVYERTASPSLSSHWLALVLVMCGFIFGAGIKYLPVVNGRGALLLSMGVTTASALFALYVNTRVLFHPSRPVASMGLLIAFNVCAIVAVYDGVRGIPLFTKPGRTRGLALIPSVFAFALIAMILMVQYGYNANSILLSAFGMLSSLGWIWFGFVRRDPIMRLFGLGFAIFSTSKLFLMDLRFLESETRIASYFVFGVVLLGISYVYQHFNKKMTALSHPVSAPEREQ